MVLSCLVSVDFRHSKYLTEGRLVGKVGSPYYIAPEVLSGACKLVNFDLHP